MILIKNVEIYTPTKRISNGAILIKNGRIAYAGPLASIPGTLTLIRKLKLVSPESGSPVKIFDLKGYIAVPGFIDIHLHGGDGSDFMDGTEEACLRVLKIHMKKGTTAAIPTLMTAAPEAIVKAIRVLNKVETAVKGRAFAAEVDPRAKPGAPAAGDVLPAVLGLHLEGPFIAMEKRGAQPESHVRPFSARELGRYVKAAGDGIKIMTLAPEISGAGPLIRELKRRRIIPSAGHSNASYDEAAAGIRAGIRHGTHLFNAMSGLFHRDPGLAGALLLDDRVTIELIADGIHLHPAMAVLVTKIKPLGKIILVTDATKQAGRSHAPLRTRDGRLFGSAITLDIALRNMLRWTGRPMTEILPMLTLNPARLLGLAAVKGRIAKGADADLVILDKKLTVIHVFVRGEKGS
jgi:N-acetylglucosamine-6-phosphate deacetylase